VKFFVTILFAFAFTSCQDNTESNDLKNRINILETRVDSLQNEIRKLSQPKITPITKKKSANKKKEESSAQFLQSEPDKQPVNTITEEKKKESSEKTNSYSSSYSSESHQCMGITKRGTRCKRMVRNGNYCWQHGG